MSKHFKGRELQRKPMFDVEQSDNVDRILHNYECGQLADDEALLQLMAGGMHVFAAKERLGLN